MCTRPIAGDCTLKFAWCVVVAYLMVMGYYIHNMRSVIDKPTFYITAAIAGVRCNSSPYSETNCVDAGKIKQLLANGGIDVNTGDINHVIDKAECVQNISIVVSAGDKETIGLEKLGHRIERPRPNAEFCIESDCAVIGTCFIAAYAQGGHSIVIQMLPEALQSSITLDI